MEEIKYFGKNASFDGKINVLQTNNDCPFKSIFNYCVPAENISEINERTFPFPIVFKLYKNNQITESRMFINYKDMIQDLKKLERDDGSLLLFSLPPYLKNEDQYIYYYVAYDFLIVQNTQTNKLFYLKLNNDELFSSIKLERSNVYRMVRQGGVGFIIENIFDRNHEYFQNLPLKSLNDFDDKDFEEFLKGYVEGYSVPIANYNLFNKIMASDCHLNHSDTGFLVAFLIKSKFREIIINNYSSVSEIDELVFQEICMNSDEFSSNLLKNLITIHNGILKSEKNVLSKIFETFGFKDMVSNDFMLLNKQMNALSKLTTFLPQHGFSEKVSVRVIDIDDNILDNIKTNSKFDHNFAQFRILNVESRTIRVQIKELSLQKETIYKGEIIKTKEVKEPTYEIDLQLNVDEKSILLLQNVDFTFPSTAGSSAKYAEMELIDGKFYCKENKVFLFDLESLVSKIIK